MSSGNCVTLFMVMMYALTLSLFLLHVSLKKKRENKHRLISTKTVVKQFLVFRTPMFKALWCVIISIPPKKAASFTPATFEKKAPFTSSEKWWSGSPAFTHTLTKSLHTTNQSLLPAQKKGDSQRGTRMRGGKSICAGTGSRQRIPAVSPLFKTSAW